MCRSPTLSLRSPPLELSKRKVPGTSSRNAKLKEHRVSLYVDAGERQVPGTWQAATDLLRMPRCARVCTWSKPIVQSAS
jgi:hypothetical protein